ncbi:MAG: SH3 domain-containing protein [Planctomycetota bacterium]
MTERTPVMRTAMAATLLILTATAIAAETSSHGLVTGESVYIRSGEAETYRSMGKLKKGEFVPVIAVSNDGKWVRITPPATADVWIFAKFVDVDGERGVVNGDNVRVRVRPDLKGEMVNKLEKETVVNVKGREGDWLKIAPPEGTVAWVHAQYIRRMTAAEAAAHRREQTDLARGEAEQKEREAALARGKREEEERRTAEAELARKRLEEEERAKDLAAQDLAKAKAAIDAAKRAADAETRLEGWVSYIGPGLEHTGATHRITRGGRVAGLVRSNRVDLGAFVGARVRITGRKHGEANLPRRGGKADIVDVAGIQIVLD